METSSQSVGETLRVPGPSSSAMLARMFPSRALYLFTACATFACATLGCADMLGLGGLTYDQGQGEIVPGAGGASENTGGSADGAGGSATIAVGGDLQAGGEPGGTTDAFSLLLDRAALLSADPRRRDAPEYFIFEPSLQKLSHRRQNVVTADLVGTWAWPAPEGFSHLIAVPFSDGITLMGYDRASGFTSQATLNDDGDFRVLSSDIGTSGRTALVPFYSGTEWLAFVYSEEDGNYRYFRPLPSTSPELFAGESEPGWTSIDRFANGEMVGVLKHNRTTNLLQFDRFVANGEPLSPVFTIQLDETFSHMVTFNENSILLYRDGIGVVVTGKVAEEQGEMRFVQSDDGHIRGDVSQIAPLAATMGASAITFSSASGRAVLNNLEPLLDEAPVVVR